MEKSTLAADAPTEIYEQLLQSVDRTLWLCCSCGHRVAVALVPFVIRWGADASSDMLGQHVRRSACGRRGATLQHPSWADSEVGWQPFPKAR